MIKLKKKIKFKPAKQRVLPNLLICGVGRAGTTATMYALNSHPDVWMVTAETKLKLKDTIKHAEMHFFTYRYDKGIDWYSKFFEDGKGHKYIGEKSPSYFIYHRVIGESEWALKRIKKALPQDTKFIVCLRDPAERCFSHWAHLKCAGYGPSYSVYRKCGTFREAIDDRSKELYPHNNIILAQSDYYLAFKDFLKVFSRDQLYILINEEVKLRPHEEYKKLFNWLGLDYGVFASVLRGPQGAYRPDLGDRDDGLTRPVIPDFVNHANYEKHGILEDEDRDYLNEYFRESKNKFYEWYGREIKLWER